MIGISAKAQKAQKEWERQDQAAWQAAAKKLESQGYTLEARNTPLPYFTKPGSETLILTRQLGNLFWLPQAK
jgi:hypothetical protein